MTALAHTYRYPFPSQLLGPRLAVAPELRRDTPPDPWFFRGTLAEPDLTASLLLVLMDVVRTRYHLPLLPSMLDPVVTANDGVLRFEGFSSCASVYARVDLPDEAVQAEVARRGTTNVDFGAPMRTALNRIRPRDRIELAVGAEAVQLSGPEGAVVEKRVKLPVRWIKGFTETAAIAPRLVPTFAVPGGEALKWLRSLPRSAGPRFTAHVTGAGRGLRLTTQPQGALPVSGIERLRLLERVAPGLQELRISHDPDTGATGWTARTATTTLSLLLSPDVSRGFSGEGQVLTDLADDHWREVLPRVRAALRWQSTLDAPALAREHGLPDERVRGALAALGSRGLVGFDTNAGAYFHRELPFDLAQVDELHPRLKEARKLVDEGGVRAEGPGVWWVRGTDTEHHVRLGADGDDRCTCTWWAKHQGERGPCKHVLAARIVAGARRADAGRRGRPAGGARRAPLRGAVLRRDRPTRRRRAPAGARPPPPERPGGHVLPGAQPRLRGRRRAGVPVPDRAGQPDARGGAGVGAGARVVRAGVARPLRCRSTTGRTRSCRPLRSRSSTWGRRSFR